MRHLKVHNKDGRLIMIHIEDLKQIFPAKDDKSRSVCVVRTKRPNGDDTFLVVNESTDEIWEQARRLRYDIEVGDG